MGAKSPLKKLESMNREVYCEKELRVESGALGANAA
jgi:hypothetical protein